MYCGEVVERAGTRQLFAEPRHRYTQRLLAAMPRVRIRPLQRLPVIPGSVPEPDCLPQGCRFSPRCAGSDERCHSQRPRMQRLGATEVACFHPVEPDEGAT